MKALTTMTGLAALSLVACKGKDGGETGGACEPEALPSVTVVVTDTSANVQEATSVVYTVDGGTPGDCQNVNQEWLCGRGEHGDFEITATADGCQEGSASVTVGLADCEIQPENLAVRLTCR